MTLQERAQELYENVHPICRQKNDYSIAWEKFIITVKNNEVVAWPLECLACTQKNCPCYSALRRSFPEKQMQK
ncbi:hypothetical protein DRQ15_05465 [candidate division KSB1 bacterium]|nr:hypothetical protein [bacterium]RKY77940.1 MAG: hypothetical protein DRQ12_07140 [candidate division KSB1 bacterium]RKY80947.1 MAG: hypothetical protein DRQ00_01155 [candidate division KSB1 bacterium]RKY86391.1 MAG: hypothetical protein DRP98_00505 [candidate division KSB1 bacterium]RKY91225.1 MAG: hypothetical protein DRQ15_05465 [candidate division KSB1 bacterium]